MASHIQVTEVIVDAFLNNKLQNYSETKVQKDKRQRDGALLILSARVPEKIPLKYKKNHDHIYFFRIKKLPSLSVRRITADGWGMFLDEHLPPQN